MLYFSFDNLSAWVFDDYLSNSTLEGVSATYEEYAVENAVDKDTGTSWYGGSASNGQCGYYYLNLSTSCKIANVSSYFDADWSGEEVTVYASNDYQNWDNKGSHTCDSHEGWHTYFNAGFDSAQTYRYFKFYICTPEGYGHQMWEWRIQGWKPGFGEGGQGNVEDLSNYGNNGTIYGATNTSGKFKQALDFDGSDDYVKVENSSTLYLQGWEEITVCVWFNSEGINPNYDVGSLVMKWEGLNFALTQNQTKGIWFELRGIDESTRSINPEWEIPQNTYCFVCGRYDGQYMIEDLFYLSTCQLESFYEGAFTIKDQGSVLTIASAFEGSDRFFNGIIDEVLIFNRSLSDSEIQELYYTGLLKIHLKDEDTEELINDSDAHVSAYDEENNILFIDDVENGTYERVCHTPSPPYLILGWSETNYTHQRHSVLYNVTFPEITEYEADIYLLKDGLGSTNYFNVNDRDIGVPIEGAWVKIIHNNKIKDYGVTDSDGVFVSYLDPYKIYSVQAGKTGYSTVSTTFYGSSIETHNIYLNISVVLERNVILTFYPEQVTDKSIPAYLFLTIENYDLLKNLTVIVAASNDFLNAYEQTGETIENVLEVYTYDFENIDWCDASTLCTGDSDTIRFRPFSKSLQTFGDHVVIRVIGYTDEGKHTWSKTGIFIVARKIADFLGMFSKEQRMFMGLFIVIFGTVTLAYELRMSFRQAGAMSIILMLAVTSFGFWEKWMLIIPLLAALYLFAWRESR